MTYSTELPPNFKTWNELWKQFIEQKCETEYPVSVEGSWKYIDIDFIKARCLDEIMELKEKINDLLDELPGSAWDAKESQFCFMFERLTHTKLFK